MMANPSLLAPHIVLPEPALSFHPDRPRDRNVHPLRGLIDHGPYSESMMYGPIRIATIKPTGQEQQLYDFIKELRAAHRPVERPDYLPDWPGFRTVFNVDMAAAEPGCHISFPPDTDDRLERSRTPHIELADVLTRTLDALYARRAEFDVAFIALPKRWEFAFHGPEGDDFDLHDHMKAHAATRRMPTQLLNEDSAMVYRCRASVMWRIGLALYTKAGGVPWTLADAIPDTAHIGLSYALRAAKEDGRFVTCCSQVFDEQGGGLEFVAYDARDVKVLRDNPYLSRNEMFRVIGRSMELYRRKHGGRSPKHVVVHKTTEFTRDETEGAFDALAACESVDLVQIVDSNGWRGIKIDPPKQNSSKGTAAGYPVERGTLLPLDDYDALFWTHGVVGGLRGQKPYFQGAKSIPEPLRLVRHAGHGSWDETARSVLALSKMDWNNDNLHDRLPVTLKYAKVLARTVKRMDSLGTTPYQVRFFM